LKGAWARSAKEELEEVYRRFTAFADRKKGVLDEEIIAIVRDSVNRYAMAASD